MKAEEPQLTPDQIVQVHKAQAILLRLCEIGDGEKALGFARNFEGPAVARVQMIALSEARVGERRGDIDLMRNGITNFEKYDQAVGCSHSDYNIARTYFSIWNVALARFGLIDALLNYREDLFTARYLYERTGANPDQPLRSRLTSWTDLANSLDNSGRHIEALEAYDHALEINPRFGMALGNRGMTLLARAARLPDFSHPVVCEAVAALDAALAEPESIAVHGDANALNIFRRERARIKGTPTHEHDPVELPEPHLEWCRANDLLLHPSPRCITPQTKLLDAVRFGHLTVGLDDESQARLRTLQDALNALLQDYISARYLGWQTAEPGSDLRHAVDVINQHAGFADTLSHARWGTATGLGLGALAAASNLLDKVAGVTHLYLQTGRDRIYFFEFWLRPAKKKTQREVDGVIEEELKAGNRGLLALCDLACEHERPGPLRTVKGQRHAVTHRAIAVHDILQDDASKNWVERIRTEELREGILDQLRRGKAALTYLVDLIVEHEHRIHPERDLPSLPYFAAVPEDPDHG